MGDLISDTPVFSGRDRTLITAIIDALHASDRSDAPELEQSIEDSTERLERLATLMMAYPSLRQSQKLGEQTRNHTTLIEALSDATPFTTDLVLPMRVMVGQTYVVARLNFFRLLHRLATETETQPAVEDAIMERISQTIHAKVIEILLVSIVGDKTLEEPVRTKGAEALTCFWEDRLASGLETFRPVLQATWEARRKITVQLGTMMGVSEIFSLMGKGCDYRFIDYFGRETCPQEEQQALEEFLFGLSKEQIESLKTKMVDGSQPVVDPLLEPAPLDASYLDHHSLTDFVTRLYLFFVKRHLEAMTRRVSGVQGPARTAEEYVMIYFLEQDDTAKITGECD
ncbi:MAG: hypothetical protein VYA69_08655 [Gemmatimonadota bacterium]|nr:hypothetical protein [Gemmatimonadota bacterium]